MRYKPAVMSDNKKYYTYNDFWEMRGRQSIWMTQNFSYRLGAGIALVASRLGLTPNMISLLSGAITIVSAWWAFYLGIQNAWSGVILIIGLQLGYAFDCADGPLARTTGQGSSFGMLVDKLVDLSSGMIFPCILAYGAGHFYILERPYTVRVLIIILILRVVFSAMLWMKELILNNADRLKLDGRSKTWWWRIKKMVSLYIDEPIYRLAISLAWIFSCFWEFFVFYNIGVLLLSFVYLASSKKDMDAMDRAARTSS